jgi:hypothetical protein
MDDYELIAQKLSGIDEKVSRLEIRMSDVLTRMADIEKVNAELEEAALNTARALAEISGHWDSVYEAMRRKSARQDGA